MDEQPDGSIAWSMLNGLLNKSNITYAESEFAFKLLGRIILAKNNYELNPDICARLPLLYFQFNSLSVIKTMINPNPEFQGIVERLGKEFGRQLFLFLTELKSVYNTANIIGFAPIMDDPYTITDFTFENFLDYIKKGAQQQELELLDKQFDEDVRNIVLEGFASALRSEIRERNPLRYLYLSKEGRLTEFLAIWEDAYTSARFELLNEDHTTETLS